MRRATGEPARHRDSRAPLWVLKKARNSSDQRGGNPFTLFPHRLPDSIEDVNEIADRSPHPPTAPSKVFRSHRARYRFDDADSHPCTIGPKQIRLDSPLVGR